MFRTLHLIGWLSPHQFSSISGALICSFIWALFLYLSTLLHCKGQSLRYSPGQGNPLCCIVTLYMGERLEREQCHLLSSQLALSNFICYPQANWALLVGRFVYVIGPCGSLQWTLLWGWEFLPPPQPPQIFSVRGFEALFPHAGTLGYVVCLTPQLFLPVYPHTNTGLPGLQAAVLPAQVLQPLPCCEFSPPQLPISTPPTSMDECFFFNSLVVGLPFADVDS